MSKQQSVYAVYFRAVASKAYVQEYCVFPVKGVSVVFTRVVPTTTTRSRVKWEVSPIIPGQDLLKAPVSVKVTENDLIEYTEKGRPEALFKKARALYDKGADIEGKTTGDLIHSNITTAVEQQIAGLAKWEQDDKGIVVEDMSIEVDADDHRFAGVLVPNGNGGYRSAAIPAQRFAQEYVHRYIHGEYDWDILTDCRRKHRNVAFKGPTGAAKTMCALAYAASEAIPVAMVSGTSSMDASVLLGQYVEDPDTGRIVWQDGPVTDVVRYGGMLLLDEISLIPNKIQTILFPLLAGTRVLTLQGHKGEIIQAHDDLMIVSTENIGMGYSGVSVKSFAMENRFVHHLDWQYDPAVEEKLIPLRTARELGVRLRKSQRNSTISSPTPTNALMDLCSLIDDFSLRYALGNFADRYPEDEREAVRQVINGLAGNFQAELDGQSITMPESQDRLAMLAAGA